MRPQNPFNLKYKSRDWLYQKYIIEEKASSDMAEIVGCDCGTIREWLENAGIKRRTNREALEIWHKYHEHPRGMLGKRHTEKTKEKMREWNANNHNPNYGKKFSKETCQKMSDHAKRRFKNRENVPAWKGGISSKNHLIRTSLEFQGWRKSVFERDDYVCQKCLERGGELHAHHIIPFAIAPEERFELDNGAALCEPCHRTIHAEEY